MEEHYKTPGVYIQEKNSFGSRIVANETAIPSFIGFTQHANQANGDPIMLMKDSKLVNNPMLINSMMEYEQYFGGPDLTGNMMVAKNQDTKAYTVTQERGTVGKAYTPGLLHPSIANFFSNGGHSCYIISLGSYESFEDEVTSEDINKEMSSIQKAIKQAELTTLILPTDLIRFGAQNYYNWGTQLINFCGEEKKYFTILDVIQENPMSSELLQSDIVKYRSVVKPITPSYAATYFPYLKSLTTYKYKSDLSNIYLNGNRLSDIDGVTNETINEIKNFLASQYINMPPSPFMAGLYSQTDNSSGVWVPPANIAPYGVTGPVVPIGNHEQENLNIDPINGISINAIRSFTGKGTLVWGARTNDGNSQDWRYINVRRLAIALENDINQALEPYIFHPNVHNTWVEIKTMIESYLFGLYNQGAFAGTTPESSYNVLIGHGITMTDEDILNGLVKVNIHFAPVRPAEFIVLEFSQLIGN